MDEKIRREEMSDIDAMNAMEEIDRISTGEGADELNGVWSSAGPRGISDGVMNSMEQIPPDEFEQGQPAEPMRERRGAGGGIWRAVGRIGVPVLLAVALAATAVWGDGQRALAEGYKQSSENMYRRAFTELCDDMSNMQTALGKLRVQRANRVSELRRLLEFLVLNCLLHSLLQAAAGNTCCCLTIYGGFRVPA